MLRGICLREQATQQASARYVAAVGREYGMVLPLDPKRRQAPNNFAPLLPRANTTGATNLGESTVFTTLERKKALGLQRKARS